MITLVRGYSTLAHLDSCYAVRKTKDKLRNGFRVIAPELRDSEVREFLMHRNLEPGGCCLREYRDD